MDLGKQMRAMRPSLIGHFSLKGPGLRPEDFFSGL